MTLYKHKSYWRSIDVDDHKKLHKETSLVKLLSKKIEEAEQCLVHKLHYALEDGGYRRYRRGKNRCLRCGLKQSIKPKER